MWAPQSISHMGRDTKHGPEAHIRTVRGALVRASSHAGDGFDIGITMAYSPTANEMSFPIVSRQRESCGTTRQKSTHTHAEAFAFAYSTRAETETTSFIITLFFSSMR